MAESKETNTKSVKGQNKKYKSNSKEGENRKTADTHTHIKRHAQCWQHNRP